LKVYVQDVANSLAQVLLKLPNAMDSLPQTAPTVLSISQSGLMEMLKRASKDQNGNSHVNMDLKNATEISLKHAVSTITEMTPTSSTGLFV